MPLFERAFRQRFWAGFSYWLSPFLKLDLAVRRPRLWFGQRLAVHVAALVWPVLIVADEVAVARAVDHGQFASRARVQPT